MTYEYDLIVIGGGPGGYVSAIRASQLGMSAALVEKEYLGGTCLNTGCIPTKALLHSARILREVKYWTSLGLTVNNAGFDYRAMHVRKDEIIRRLGKDIKNLLANNNVPVISGRAQIVGGHQVRVGGKIYTAERILVATGTVPAKPIGPGYDLPNVVTCNNMLQNKLFFPRLVIIGGGVVGMEFAALFNALGCDVTVFEAMSRVLPALDREISLKLTETMSKRGVNIFCGGMVTGVEQEQDGLRCYFTHRGEIKSIAADGVLVAVGRRGNTDKLFAGVDVDTEHGLIRVDSSYRTNIESVYAIGDVTYGSRQLAHAASTDGINAVSMMAGLKTPLDMRYVASCIFTDPEIATVGLSADEAKAAGIPAKTGKYVMSSNGKSIIEQREQGYIKLVAEAGTGRLLGAQLICCHATDLINELVLAVTKGMTANDIAAVIHPHPTLGEGVAEAAKDVYGRSIFIPPHD